jgi:hypothetical protein
MKKRTQNIHPVTISYKGGYRNSQGGQHFWSWDRAKFRFWSPKNLMTFFSPTILFTFLSLSPFLLTLCGLQLGRRGRKPTFNARIAGENKEISKWGHGQIGPHKSASEIPVDGSYI